MGLHGGLVLGAVRKATESGACVAVMPREVERSFISRSPRFVDGWGLYVFSDEIIAVLPGGGTEYLAGKEMP